MRIGIFAAAALVTASTAIAAPAPAEQEEAHAAAPAESAAAADAEPAEEKKICRTDRATGSLTRRTRICLTQAQWRDLNSRTQRGVSEMQGQGSGGQQVNRDAERGGF